MSIPIPTSTNVNKDTPSPLPGGVYANAYFSEDTRILLKNHQVKLAKDITENDILMGDDGNGRYVLGIATDSVDLWEIPLIGQKFMKPITISKDHIICFKYTRRPEIAYLNRESAFNVRWFDGKSIISNNFSVNVDKARNHFKTKEEAFAAANRFNENIERQEDAKESFLKKKLEKPESTPGIFLVQNPTQSFYTSYCDKALVDGKPAKVKQHFRFSQDYDFYATKAEIKTTVLKYLEILKTNPNVIRKGATLELTLEEYMNLKTKVKTNLKVYRASLLDYPDHGEALPIDPYVFGLWIGDGDRKRANIANNHEKPIVTFLAKYAEAISMDFVSYHNTVNYGFVRKEPHRASTKTLSKTVTLDDNEEAESSVVIKEEEIDHLTMPSISLPFTCLLQEYSQSSALEW